MAGIDSDGLTIKTLAEIKSSLETRAKDAFGAGANVTPSGALGLLIGLFSDPMDQGWQGVQGVYDARAVGNAIGIPLDNLAELKGLKRLAATHSTAGVSLTGTSGTIAPGGSTIFSVGSGGDEYVLDEDVTVPGSGTVTASEPGEKTGDIGAIDTIVTPVAGLTAVNNASAIVPGRERETDAELRTRMKLSSQAPGSQTVGAIKAALELVAEVQYVFVRENDTDDPQAPSPGINQPPHSIMPVIYPSSPDQDDLAQTIFDLKPAGIQSYGTTTVTVVDSQGAGHIIGFEFADTVDVEVNIEVVVDSEYPEDGDTQIEDDIAAFITALTNGEDVKVHELVGVIDDVGGIVSITTLEVRESGGGWQSTNLVIADNEKPLCSSTDVSVSSS